MTDLCSPLPAIISGVVGIVFGWMVGAWAEEAPESENKNSLGRNNPTK